MRLLTAKQIEGERKQEQSHMVQKGVRIATHVEKLRKELNDLKNIRGTERAMVEAEFNNFLLEMGKKQLALSNEVSNLENRKKSLVEQIRRLEQALEKIQTLNI